MAVSAMSDSKSLLVDTHKITPDFSCIGYAIGCSRRETSPVTGQSPRNMCPLDPEMVQELKDAIHGDSGRCHHV